MRDREHVFGAKAAMTTMWWLVNQRIDAAHLPGTREHLNMPAPEENAAKPANRSRHHQHYTDEESRLVLQP
ncbi:hypothetical protein AN480_29430 [Mycobacterium intracellulare subsp. chimaera]|uniref:Uncharacterized protein n=1 Tax=Mycobacterium asiaticum TaxID=1790 RepID=A0A1A3BPQ9_MYCAS|nr:MULTISPECIES: hypothetical protein [Mycobacterium]APD83930.1 hypothetical protein AN480_29430 [Mycobacterium intracellulare subsp. chimaera]OBI76969.1 hypothetical protein A9X01_03030 [Mycobacterium asiaticum]